MIKRLMISLFAMGLIAIAGSEVNAGCANIGGTRMCASWITGSEICSVSIQGGGSCTPGVDCPIVTCSVFGTTNLGDGLCDPNTLDPECGLTGTSFCINPATKASKAQGNSFTLNQSLVQLPLTKTSECQLHGSQCTTSNEVDIADADCPECCANPNWILVTFTSPDFNAEVCGCVNGVDNTFETTGQCCADKKRTAGLCASYTDPTCIAEHCTVNLTGYKPGAHLNYTCTPLP